MSNRLQFPMPSTSDLSATPSIGIDDYAAARQVTAHLVSLGHRQRVYLG